MSRASPSCLCQRSMRAPHWLRLVALPWQKRMAPSDGSQFLLQYHQASRGVPSADRSRTSCTSVVGGCTQASVGGTVRKTNTSSSGRNIKFSAAYSSSTDPPLKKHTFRHGRLFFLVSGASASKLVNRGSSIAKSSPPAQHSAMPSNQSIQAGRVPPWDNGQTTLQVNPTRRTNPHNHGSQSPQSA